MYPELARLLEAIVDTLTAIDRAQPAINPQIREPVTRAREALTRVQAMTGTAQLHQGPL